jgi:hypothetical protein
MRSPALRAARSAMLVIGSMNWGRSGAGFGRRASIAEAGRPRGSATLRRPELVPAARPHGPRADQHRSRRDQPSGQYRRRGAGHEEHGADAPVPGRSAALPGPGGDLARRVRGGCAGAARVVDSSTRRSATPVSWSVPAPGSDASPGRCSMPGVPWEIAPSPGAARWRCSSAARTTACPTRSSCAATCTSRSPREAATAPSTWPWRCRSSATNCTCCLRRCVAGGPDAAWDAPPATQENMERFYVHLERNAGADRLSQPGGAAAADDAPAAPVQSPASRRDGTEHPPRYPDGNAEAPGREPRQRDAARRIRHERTRLSRLPVDHARRSPGRRGHGSLPDPRRHLRQPASRSHRYGWEAEMAVEAARQQLASLIGADLREIVWTSGATEADNLAIRGVVEAARPRALPARISSPRRSSTRRCWTRWRRWRPGRRRHLPGAGMPTVA